MGRPRRSPRRIRTPPPAATTAAAAAAALLALLAEPPRAAALTVGYYNDASCTSPNTTRTVWLGLCQGGLAVAECWTLPPGNYSPGTYDESLTATLSWAVLEEFAGGACPAQSAGAGGAGVVSAPSLVSRAYSVDPGNCQLVASPSLGMYARVIGNGECSVRSAPAAVLNGYVNYTTAVVTDHLGAAPVLGFFNDAACLTPVNSFSYVTGFCMAGLMVLDFGSDAAGVSWATLTANGPNICPPHIIDEPLFETGGWALSATTDSCVYNPRLDAVGLAKYVSLLRLDVGTGVAPLLLGQYSTPASANCSRINQAFFLPFLPGPSCQFSYNDFMGTPGASSVIMQSSVVAGAPRYSVTYYSSVTNCSPVLKSATFVNAPLGACVNATTGAVALNAEGFGLSIVVRPAPSWRSGPAAEYALLHPAAPVAVQPSPAAAGEAAASLADAVGGAVGAVALAACAAAAVILARRRRYGGSLGVKGGPGARGGSVALPDATLDFASHSPLLESALAGAKTISIPWSSLEPDLSFSPMFGGFGVVFRAKWHGEKPVAVKVPIFSIKYGGLPEAAATAIIAEVKGLILAQHDGANDHVVHLHGVAQGLITDPRWDALLMRARTMIILKESGHGSGNGDGSGGASNSREGNGGVPVVLAAAPVLVVPAEASRRKLDGFVMSWEGGGSLDEALYPDAKKLRAPWPTTMIDRLRVCAEAAAGIWHLHHAGLVHGDIKPQNVLLDDDGRVRLTDFGLAKVRAADSASTESRLSTMQTTDEKRGTWVYMAPEMFRGGMAAAAAAPGAAAAASSGGREGGTHLAAGSSGAAAASGAAMASSVTAAAAASRSTDVYAFGTLMWEILTGRQPWAGHNEASRLTALLRGEQLDLAQLPLATPPPVRRLVESCLDTRRAARPHMGELRATLERELLVAQDERSDVFLSYAWGLGGVRKPLTDAIYSALRADGLRVWLDSEDMGHDLQASMREGVARSSVVVALVSPDYAASANCMFELREAVVTGKPLVTCVVEPGFWRQWTQPGGAVRAVPDDHEIVRLARLKTHLYVDFGSAARGDWSEHPVAEEVLRRLVEPEALPRLQQQLRAVLPASAAHAAMRSVGMRRFGSSRPQSRATSSEPRPPSASASS